MRTEPILNAVIKAELNASYLHLNGRCLDTLVGGKVFNALQICYYDQASIDLISHIAIQHRCQFSQHFDNSILLCVCLQRQGWEAIL